MKYVLLICCFIIPLSVTGQALLNYKDTINHFALAVPVTWHYEDKYSLPEIKLEADYGSSMEHRETFNVAVGYEPSSNMHAVLKDLLYELKLEGKVGLMDSGNVRHNGQQFQWIDEWYVSRHRPKDTVFSTVFIGNENKRMYMFRGISNAIDSVQYRQLFHQMGETFRIGNASKDEELKLVLPEGWQVYTDVNDLSVHTIQFLPLNESAQNWTSMITSLTHINIKDSINSTYRIQADITRELKPLAKISILEQGTNWQLFKIEETSVPDEHPSPASQVWYVVQGKKSLHTVSITIREATITEAFIKKWSEIFKKSKIVNQ